jgi:hypothetical protein
MQVTNLSAIRRLLLIRQRRENKNCEQYLRAFNVCLKGNVLSLFKQELGQ